tara:strand:- start:2954 stop:4585 length:1632 start_codon:yes stop_codon:yes gene_type:complete
MKNLFLKSKFRVVMLRKYTRATISVVITVFLLGSVISCEEDFTDIGTSIVSNGAFTTNDTVFEIEVTGKNIEKVQADGLAIGGLLGQYLLGVYNNNNYKKIEASIISQLSIPQDLTQVDQEYGSDTIVVTTIDTILLRIPYNASLLSTSTLDADFELDSIIGNQLQPFTLNVFRVETYLSTLNPTTPSIQNMYFSDDNYEVSTEKLNLVEDIQFTPNRRDTAHFVTRKLSTGLEYDTDTIRYINSSPSISIPLKEDLIKELIFDQYETSNFASQDAFNSYFRGIKIQAEGDQGSLISLSLNSNSLQPLIDIYYTNTVLVDGGTVVLDTIKKTDTFLLSGIRNSEYKMTPGQIPGFNNVPIQGAAGSIAQLKILGDDNDLNGIPDHLEELRTKNWLINGASITLYVDKDIIEQDTTAIPYRLFIYKDGLNIAGEEIPRQIIDYITEGVNQVGGLLELDDSNKPNSYTFNITDYISELLAGDTDDLPVLGVRVLNPTDLPATSVDTIVRNYNWNPKAIMLLNNNTQDVSRRAKLKISYTLKTENN